MVTKLEDEEDDWFCDICGSEPCVCEPIDPKTCTHDHIELEELSDSLIWEVCQDCGTNLKIVGQFGYILRKL